MNSFYIEKVITLHISTEKNIWKWFFLESTSRFHEFQAQRSGCESEKRYSIHLLKSRKISVHFL